MKEILIIVQIVVNALFNVFSDTEIAKIEKKYISTETHICKSVEIKCHKVGEKPFNDENGCGCILINEQTTI